MRARPSTHDFRFRLDGTAFGFASAVLLLIGLLGLPEPGVAGTGRLVSQWMSRAPRIDGQIAAAEWSEAKLVDLGAGVTLRIGNDARTLYLAALDSADTTLHTADAIYMLFDDEGGVAPILDDSAWANAGCQGAPNLGEGNLIFDSGQGIRFQELYGASFCALQSVTGLAGFAVAAHPDGVSYEIAIPLDGVMPLQASAGQRFGIWFRVWRGGLAGACLPATCAGLQPSAYQNLVLASAGCNSGPQQFGTGQPQIGLPLDWSTVRAYGTGTDWMQSTVYGDPVFCQDNSTGSNGGTACIATALFTSTSSTAHLYMPLTLRGQTTASIRLRAMLDTIDTFDALSFGTLRQDTTLDYILHWGLQNYPGQQLEIAIPQEVGNPPTDFVFTHYTAAGGGVEGGYAQIDDVELLCGPVLFADGFESGLATHWSATVP